MIVSTPIPLSTRCLVIDRDPVSWDDGLSRGEVTMPSRILPIEEIERLGPNYFLPAGGQDNGVPAISWAIIAELDTDEVGPLLSQLADLGVGAYAASRSGLTPRTGPANRRLYVDTLQYNQAVEALMIFLRAKETRDLGGYVPTTRSSKKAPAPVRSSPVRIAIMAAKIVLGAVVLALLLALGYQSFVNQFAAVRPAGHHGQDSPGIHRSIVPPARDDRQPVTCGGAVEIANVGAPLMKAVAA